MTFKDHSLSPATETPGLRYEETPLTTPAGAVVPGLHVVRITLDNPSQLNSYTTEMVKGVILGMRRASNDRAAVYRRAERLILEDGAVIPLFHIANTYAVLREVEGLAVTPLGLANLRLELVWIDAYKEKA